MIQYKQENIIEYLNYDNNANYTNEMIETIKITDNTIIVRLLENYVKLRNVKGYALEKSSYISWLRSKKLKQFDFLLSF